jgi:Na+/H+-dicarboxylate symporter
MTPNDSSTHHPSIEPRQGLWAIWHNIPLYLRIIAGLVLGVVVGLVLGEKAVGFALPSQLILRMLGALAPPLILVAIIRVLMRAQITGGIGKRLVGLLLLNTIVAICIGIVVANVVRPGERAVLKPHIEKKASELETEPQRRAILEVLEKHDYKPAGKKDGSLISQFLDNIPRSLFGPLTDKGSVISVIFIAVAFGIAMRMARDRRVNTAGDLIDVAFDSMLVVLHWIIDLVPIGVFGIVSSIVGKEGFEPFKALGAFVVAVVLALLLQGAYYLLRIQFGSWVRPLDVLKGTRDALVMAFSTASSTITMPVTYACLKERVGLREESASMGALVGSNFNNDGTALYEAMAAMFISQMLVMQGIGHSLTLTEQLLVVLTSVLASVGAAGIPEAGLVTMTLVFTAVGLPPEYIVLLLTVDWFLDRCRTAINVMGDINVSCMLDGKFRENANVQEQGPLVSKPSMAV